MLIANLIKDLDFHYVFLIFLTSLTSSWVVPLKDKKGVTIVRTFQKVLDKLAHKPNKIWVEK